MAEILGFYELLHSAGGCVSEVMCSARLHLNSLDIEKGWNQLTWEEQRGAQVYDYFINIIDSYMDTVRELICITSNGGIMYD